MKTVIFIATISILSCSSIIKNDKEDIEGTKEIEAIKSFCPENGICTFKISKNKRLNLLKDGIGQLYPKISNGNATVYKFTYTKNKDERYQDSHYSEEVYFELPKSIDELNIKNQSLSKVKLLFGRLCFCRGQTGYYKISQGKLLIQKLNNNSYQVNLSFNTNDVPQIITKISEIIIN